MNEKLKELIMYEDGEEPSKEKYGDNILYLNYKYQKEKGLKSNMAHEAFLGFEFNKEHQLVINDREMVTMIEIFRMFRNSPLLPNKVMVQALKDKGLKGRYNFISPQYFRILCDKLGLRKIQKRQFLDRL